MMQRLGRYEIHHRIASGGMATVYLGRVVGEGGFQRLVAVKMMHPHLADDPDFVSMFLDEARLAALIRHPNVVATLDVQRVPEGLFLVMDYIDGPTLGRILKLCERARHYMDLGIALRIFLDTLAGLDAAHDLIGPGGERLNLVHRDVSPSNVLVGSDGISRITDFGIARAEARITSTRGKQLKGKLPYMAPEQLSSQPIDRRVDVYAAGCVLWEVLTLQRLFQGDDEAQLLAAVLMGEKKPPNALRGDVPPTVSQVCMQALAKVEHRYPSAAAFADALEEAARQDNLRIATVRDVGRFVKELAPSTSEPLAGTEPSQPQPSAVLGVTTPQRWQMTPPVAAIPPMPYPGAGSTPGAVDPGSGLPNTIASMVATPAPSALSRRTTLLAMLAAVGLAVFGGAIAWLAMAPSHTNGVQAASTGAAAQSAASSKAPDEPGPTEPQPSATGTAAASASTAAPSGSAARSGDRPKPTATAKAPSTGRPPPPPGTSTEFRPAHP